MKACGCRNHKGHQKVMHKSRDAAVKQLCTPRYRDGLTYHIYECPAVPGVFHVTTKTEKVSRHGPRDGR